MGIKLGAAMGAVMLSQSLKKMESAQGAELLTADPGHLPQAARRRSLNRLG